MTDSSLGCVLPGVGLGRDNHRVAAVAGPGDTSHKGWLFITLILVMHSLNVGPAGDVQNMINLCPVSVP